MIANHLSMPWNMALHIVFNTFRKAYIDVYKSFTNHFKNFHLIIIVYTKKDYILTSSQREIIILTNTTNYTFS